MPLTDFTQVEGLCNEPELRRLAELASEVPEGRVIVELGSYRGQSTVAMASSASVPVFAVDTWPDEPITYGDIVYGLDAFHDFQENTEGLDVTPIRGRAVDVAKDWDKPVGLLFIDSDHDYGSVRADYNAWRPHVVKGGYVVFHDYLLRGAGVRRFADQVARRGWDHIEIVESETGAWVGRVA